MKIIQALASGLVGLGLTLAVAGNAQASAPTGPFDGQYVFNLNGGGATGSFTQTLNGAFSDLLTVHIGQTGSFSFTISAVGASISDFTLWAWNAGNSSWSSLGSAGSFIGTTHGGYSNVLAGDYQFKLTGNGNSQLSMSVAAVPEPGEWAMMLAGLGIIGFVAKRKRATLIAA